MKYRNRVLGLLSLLLVITYLDRVCSSVAGPHTGRTLRKLQSPFHPHGGMLFLGAWMWLQIDPAQQLSPLTLMSPVSLAAANEAQP